MAENSEGKLTVADRLAALLDHLGIETAHVATQMPGDVSEFAALRPKRVGGAVFAVPVRLDPAPFARSPSRLSDRRLLR